MIFLTHKVAITEVVAVVPRSIAVGDTRSHKPYKRHTLTSVLILLLLLLLRNNLIER
jgi:hypothetical protein